MKNKIIIFLIILLQVFNVNKVLSKEVEFKASEIEISNDKNITTANEGIAVIQDDGIIIEGAKIKYLKKESLLIVEYGKISTLDKNLEIISDNIEYKIDKSELNLKQNVKITEKLNNLLINANEISYDVESQKIKSKNYSEIKDDLGNIYKVEKFEYSLKDKIIKLNNINIIDIEENFFKIDLAFLDLNKKELIAKDIDLNFKISPDSENEPRLKGRSLVSNKNNTIVKKGTFTFCKKREKCPPWEMSANEIRHDKIKKTIYYKNASLKIYDNKVFYFPKFFHPDPTVKRQSGFLIPRLQDNTTTGLSLNLPYFIAISDNKDMTLNPRFFADDQFLLQSEFRQKNKDSNHIADLSQFISENENSKGHLFYNFFKNYKNETFDEIDLNINLEQVSDETYLKAYKIKSPIINNTSNLTNSINANFYNDRTSINTNLDIYEDLSKEDSDKYEYVPNFSFSKVINNNYSINSKGYYKNYNTNITEKVLINNFEFSSTPKYLDNGLINETKFLVKNVNSEANNSKNFKNEKSIYLSPTMQSNYSFPLEKNTNKFNNIIKPKISLKLSLPHNKDVRNSDQKINYENIYDLDRLNIPDTSEGGISLTYGYEYTKINKFNLDQSIKFGIANNLRFEENKDLPSNSNLGDKVSDFVGLLQYQPNENLKFDYDFSFKNNLTDKNYELFGFEYFLNNLSTKFEYLNENNSNSKTSYLLNQTKFNFNNNNSLIFEARENKEKSFTEFYNLIYQYKNDCLTAGIEYNKEFYNDQDLKPSENLFFKISILPFGGFNSPNLK